MKLTNGGITINVGKADVDFYLRHGYKKIEEPVVIPAPGIAQELPPEKAAMPVKVAEPVEKTQKVSIEKIYALCDKAEISPDELVLRGEYPSLAEVKAAIKAAKVVKHD